MSSPRRRVWPEKCRALCVAMKRAVNTETGVSSATTAAMAGLSTNMNTSVTTMVRMPVGSCWNAMSSPLESWSASVTMRLARSPCPWESR